MDNLRKNQDICVTDLVEYFKKEKRRIFISNILLGITFFTYLTLVGLILWN